MDSTSNVQQPLIGGSTTAASTTATAPNTPLSSSGLATATTASCPIKAAVQTAAAIASASPDIVLAAATTTATTSHDSNKGLEVQQATFLPLQPPLASNAAATSLHSQPPVIDPPGSRGGPDLAAAAPAVATLYNPSKHLVTVAPKPAVTSAPPTASAVSSSNATSTAATPTPTTFAAAPPPLFPTLTAFVGTQTLPPQCLPGHPAMHAQQQQVLSPCLSYAQLVKRRAGKWTLEEEDYAAVLIELFEKGQVLDEKNGVTLRSFLSRKLFCAPMRISKKFAGKGIGKKVFSSKVNSPFLDTNKSLPASFYANMNRLREAEMKFLRVAFPDLPGLINPVFGGPLMAAVPFPIMMNGAIHPASTTLGTPLAPQAVAPQTVALPSHIGVNAGPTVSHPPSVPLQRPSLFQATSGAAPAAATASVSTTPAIGAAAVAKPHHVDGSSNVAQLPTAGNVQPTMVNSAPAVAALPTQLASNNPTSGTVLNRSLHSATAKSPSTLQGKALNARSMVTSRAIQEHCVSGVLDTATAVANPQINRNVHGQVLGNSPDDVRTTEDKSHPHISHPHAGAMGLVHRNALPDLLSGFDKFAASKGVPYQYPSTAQAQFSPTYTTDSFDDLHKYLGKGLTPLAQCLQSGTQGPSNATGGVAPNLQIPKSKATAERRLPQSKLQMRPLERNGTWIAPKQRPVTNPTTTNNADGSLVPPVSHQSAADSYNLFAQESAQAARQNGAYFHGHHVQEHRGQARSHHQDNAEDGAVNTDFYPITLPAVYRPMTVSEPSTDDPNSGTESGFADSDETHSEASFHPKRKEPKLSEEDEDTVHHWYQTLLQD